MAADSQRSQVQNDADMNIIRPPIVRGITQLQPALFTKTFDLAAASVKDNRNISKYRQALEKSSELLRIERFSSVAPDPDPALAKAGRRCLVLRPGIVSSAPETWSETLKDGVKQDNLSVVPYELKLDYEHWSAREILGSILPEEFEDDLPSAFNSAGHVAHLNLRSQYLPYKSIIGRVIAEKNPRVKTVINKVDNVGDESAFRTFSYEVLAGPDDLNVEVHENDCTYMFDYAKVYWNSKLDKEHLRVASLAKPGEVVCDVMAGIGPFAVPAGKRQIFVWANDMNPESYFYLLRSIKNNKASEFVRPFNMDGKDFIHHAADSVLKASLDGEFATLPPPKPKRGDRSNPQQQQKAPKPEPKRIPIPPTISHFVMNLPASAITFLPRYKGLYDGHKALFAPTTETKLPMVHVHCFSHKSEDDTPKLDICERISKELGLEMKLGADDADAAANDRVVSVREVRAVAPKKVMFCASFRLPPEIAFAPRAV